MQDDDVGVTLRFRLLWFLHFSSTAWRVRDDFARIACGIDLLCRSSTRTITCKRKLNVIPSWLVVTFCRAVAYEQRCSRLFYHFWRCTFVRIYTFAALHVPRTRPQRSYQRRCARAAMRRACGIVNV